MKAWIAAAALALSGCNQPAPDTAAPEPEAARPVNAPSGEYALDPNHTTVTVRAPHFGLSNYVLRFNRVSGALTFNADDPTQSRVQATVDVTSLDTPYAGDRDFDAELQNSAWLDSATFGTATFTSTGVERTTPNTARVTGDLTIRGQTHPATFDVTYNASHAQHPAGPRMSMIGFTARTTVTRSAYGLAELQPSAPGAPDGVGDRVEIVIEAEFTRPVEQDTPAPAQPAEPVN